MSKRKPILLALNNHIAGSGKDSVADYLVEKHGFRKYSLSEGIYEVAYNIFGVPNGTKPPRKLLHHIGESLREYDILIWIKRMLAKIEQEGHDRIVVTDVRKLLEHAYLAELGYYNVKVYCDEETAMKRVSGRDGVNADLSSKTHNSPLESQLRSIEMPIIDNSGEWDETVRQIEFLLKNPK